MKKILNKIWGMIHRGFFLKLLAVVLAFIIWSYVVAGTNPIRSKDVSEVALSFANTAELTAKNLVVDSELSDIPETVNVKVEANVESHKNINANSIRATVNLAEINSVGDVTLNITATSTQSGVVVKNISPSRVTLRIDELVERRIPVTAQLTGTAPTGYYISPPKLSEDSVVLKGPQKKIETIAKAICEIPVDDLRENLRASYLLKLYDANGEEVDAPVGESPSIIADITVLPSKTVAIRPDDVISAVTNLKAGYEVNSVVIEPSTVEIAADRATLNGITSLRLQPINAEEADDTVMLEAELQVPEGIAYISRSAIDVLLQVGEIRAEKSFKNRKIELINLNDGLTAQIVDEKYANVTVVGGKSAMDPVTAQDVKLYVDMANVTVPGTYVYAVEVDEIAGIPKSGVTVSVKEVTVRVTK